jgi:hypothetical protein
VTGGGRSWTADLLTGVAVYAVTALPVAAGLAAATTPGLLPREGPPPDVLSCCCYFDGGHYWNITTRGYWVSAEGQSPVAFFPGYPLAARLIAWATGSGAKLALVVTSNLALVAALALLSAYLRAKDVGAPPGTRLATVALVGVWPVGFYFRMAYSESLFLALVALLMLGMVRRWPVWVLAAVAGAATGVRAVGVAASAAAVVHVLCDPARGPLRNRIATAALLAPLSCWGLFAFMGFQYLTFGDALAFAEAQRHWVHYTPAPGDTGPRWLRLALAEPLWNVYVPGSARHWTLVDRHGNPLLGLAFWNPLLFALALAAVVLGWWRRWLSGPEAVLGLGLLLIPYVSRADEWSMISQARFASVALPALVVLGRLAARLPRAASGALFAVLSGVLGLWTALFATARPMF